MGNGQKIAFLCHPYHRGGVTRWMADAALAYARQGYEVYFITIEPVKEFFSAKGRETLLQLLNKEPNSVHVLQAKAGSEFEFGTAEYRAYIYRQLILKLPQGTPLILSDDETVWYAATFLNDSYPVIGVLHADEEYYYALAKKYATQVHALVCVSERVHTTVVKRLPAFDPALISTIPCGINLPENDFDTHRGDKLQLIYVGRVGEYQKRVSDLVKICEVLTKKGTVFHLSVIGDGEVPMLESKFRQAGLEDKVTFCGWLQQKDVARYLAQSDILVLTSDFEGTPVAMMEALASGCGFVGTRVSGIEDYEYHNNAADCFSVYAVGDIEDAVNKVEKIAGIPVGVRKQAARALAESEFSMAVCLKKYNNVIATIKNDTKPAREVKLPMLKQLQSRVIATARSLKVNLKS